MIVTSVLLRGYFTLCIYSEEMKLVANCSYSGYWMKQFLTSRWVANGKTPEAVVALEADGVECAYSSKRKEQLL